MDVIGFLKAIIILQFDGKRLLAKYFTDNLNAKSFEKKLFTKTKAQKLKDEIFALDGLLISHKCMSGCHFYVVGGRDDNPLTLDCVLNCLTEVVSSLSPNNERTGNLVLSNTSRVISALDVICDNGFILEEDPKLVLERTDPSTDNSSGTMTETLFGKLGKYMSQ